MSDRDEISELLSNYAWAMDAGDFGALEDMLDDDVSFAIEIPGADTIGPIEPRDAVIEFISSTVSGQQDQRRHVISNQRFERRAGDQADVTATLTLNVIADAKLTVQATGIYRFGLVRRADGWRVAQLTILLDLPF